MSDHQETNSTNSGESPAHEPLVAPLVEETKRPWGPIIGGIAVAGALIGGVWFATSGDSEVDIASTDPTEEVAEEEGSEEEPVTEETSGDSDDVAGAAAEAERAEEVAEEEAMYDEAFAEDAAMDSYYGGVSSMAVWDGEQFVRLERDSSSWTVFTSAEGVDWVESPVTGLPADGYMYQIIEQDGVLLGLLDRYDENGPSYSLASSTNATDWTTVALPGGGEGSESNYSGLAVLDGNVVTTRMTYDHGGDPYFILMEAGLLTGELEEEFCGFDYENEGDPIDLLVCDYAEYEENYPTDEEIDALAARYDAAQTDEERRAIEEELDKLWGGGSEEVFATINPGDPLYAELSASMFGDYETQMTTEVVTGPIAGPFDVSSPFAQDGYMTGLFQTDSALFVGFESYNELQGESNLTILTSTDGQNWSEVGSPPAAQGGNLQAFGDVLFFMSYSFDGSTTSYISTDGAATWTESSLESDLYEQYTDFRAGEPGIVALTQGALEPYEYGGPFGTDENPVIEKDGYTLELGWYDGSMTLSGPNGVLIELTEEDAWTNESDVVRTNPINGNMTFIDEETGEDLVTFTDEDWEAAYGSFEEEYYGEEVYEEPERGYEVAFSVDGVNWSSLETRELDTLGPNSYVGFVGIGDDEVVFFVETYTETEFPEEIFAFEEEGREPTAAEIEAIELWEQGQSTIEYVRIPLG